MLLITFVSPSQIQKPIIAPKELLITSSNSQRPKANTYWQISMIKEKHTPANNAFHHFFTGKRKPNGMKKRMLFMF